MTRSVAVFGLLFGAQTVPAMVAQIDQAPPVWAAAVVTGLFGSLILAFAASLAQFGVRVANHIVPLAYVAALISWPFTVEDPASASAGNHWLYYMLTVATSSAAIGMSRRWATAYLLAVPVLYGVIRLTPQGGGSTGVQAALDVMYAILLGGAVLIMMTMLRQASSAVDAAQSTALDRYGSAVRQHATDLERVQVDAIVHDSVLTTFISAGRAESPEAKALAADMARLAIRHLRDAAAVGPDDGTTIRANVVAKRIAAAAGAVAVDMDVVVQSVGAVRLPTGAADALYSAAVQAVVNSQQHAGHQRGIRRWVRISGIADGLAIEVGDTGVGFDVDTIPQERLGVRVSIIERLEGVGGRAEVRSAPGHGCVVDIRWPHRPASPGSPVEADDEDDEDDEVNE
ncbi:MULTISPECIES: ATP-binding protein [unclassified Diaminobutyricimonas]|uniref:sensor histidine kinase n=1 Tax=unclassified Diaminobutyricimonas TaxID=2643261 RepID=UPI0018E016D6|nr:MULTISPECIES: ATP-binding protein [unclassified Diaminobutyricimonas]